LQGFCGMLQVDGYAEHNRLIAAQPLCLLGRPVDASAKAATDHSASSASTPCNWKTDLDVSMPIRMGGFFIDLSSVLALGLKIIAQVGRGAVHTSTSQALSSRQFHFVICRTGRLTVSLAGFADG
jgi:hypothetical protein